MAQKKSAKKGMGASFYVTLVFLIVLPAFGLVGWYLLAVTESQKAAGDLLAQARSVTSKLVDRAVREGFSMEDFDECKKMESHFKTALSYDFDEKSRRKMLGLSADASDENIQERCVVFAKIVSNMEKLTHHDRHVFVCQGASFNADNDVYKLIPDAEGKGAIEIDTGAKTFIPIKPHRFILKEIWQVYNVGDGCLVIGMSRQNNFSYTGIVKFDD